MKHLQLNCYFFSYGESILKYLANEKPDVACLQELATGGLSRSTIKDPITEIEELGYHVHYSPRFAKREKDGSVGYFGNAIISRHGFIDTHTIFDPKLPTPKPT